MQAIQVEAVRFFFPCFSFAYDTCSLVIVCLCVCVCVHIPAVLYMEVMSTFIPIFSVLNF